MSSILLVPIPPVDRELINILISPLQQIFGMPVTVQTHNRIDPTPAADPIRNQYNSSILLTRILAHRRVTSGKVLGVTGLDLFVPVLTFVFGEAQLDGTAALVSTCRLDESFYGLPSNPSLLRERLIKEAVHELGHTFGLIHCLHIECVMHSSTSVEEIDLKGMEMCKECRSFVQTKTL